MNDFGSEKLEQITDAVLASYGSDARTQRIGHMFLPSRAVIVEVMEEVRRLLFPG